MEIKGTKTSYSLLAIGSGISLLLNVVTALLCIFLDTAPAAVAWLAAGGMIMSAVALTKADPWKVVQSVTMHVVDDDGKR